MRILPSGLSVFACAVSCILLLHSTSVADEPVQAPVPPAATAADVTELAAEIDRLIAARWAEEGVTPADVVDDAAFLRRVSLDLIGRIPSVSETRAFLADDDPDKRRRVVDRLLASSAYVNHFTTLWRRVLLPEADTDFQARYMAPGFESWLQARLEQNVGYDKLVREILVEPQSSASFLYSYQSGRVTSYAFFQAKQNKPEELGAATSRIFLGVRLECAQCHDHPFDAWQRKQFWSLAAFYAPEQSAAQPRTGFAGLLSGLFGGSRQPPKGLRIPETETFVTPAFLNNEQPPESGSARETLADWIVSKDNPYFARTAVNRLWAQLFGIGLVDPIDDFGASNPASHPELLQTLAREFASHRFDAKFLIRAMTASRTYQLASAVSDPSQTDNPRLFARKPVTGLSAEQLFDSLAQATGHREPEGSANAFAFDFNSRRAKFLELFDSNSEQPVARETTILQALSMMNGELTADATSLERSRTLTAIAEYPLMSTAERVEALYLAALSRGPRPEESARLTAYIDARTGSQERHRALSDVFWALLNSSEFKLNH